MPTKTIKHAGFSFFVEAPDPIRPGKTIMVERKAYKGDTVDIPFEDDLLRGQRFGAFTDAPKSARSAAVVAGEPPESKEIPEAEVVEEEPDEDEEEESSVADMTDEELFHWIKHTRPRVQAVIDAAEGDSEQAKRLLEAEDRATGGDPRRGVVTGLSHIIGQG